MVEGSAVVVARSGAVIHQGEGATRLYQAKVIRQGVRACRRGMRLNRSYTPTAVLRTAGNITGQTYKRGEYDRAEADLDKWIAERTAEVPLVED